MNFKVMDDSGKVLGQSRDLPALQRRFSKESAGSVAGIGPREWNRDGIVRWDFGDLPESVTVQRFGMTIVAYPAVVDLRADWPAEHWQCGLRLLPSKEAAEEAHRVGVRRLFWMEYRRDVKGLTGKLPDFGKMKLQYLLLGRSEELRVDLLTLIVDRALFGDGAAPRKQAAFEELKREAATRLYETAEKVGALVGEILEEHLKLALVLEEEDYARGRLGSAATDVHDQLVFLLVKHFLVKTPYHWLQQFPRYVAGMRLRLEKLRQGGAGIVDRDREGMEKVRARWNQYLERKRGHDAVALLDAELELLRWMIEEWRVAVFSQELGTAMPVSERRVEKQMEKVRRV
jgi:ATP-dependent helicase HrpA